MKRHSNRRAEVGARERCGAARGRGVIDRRGRGIVRRAKVAFIAIPRDAEAGGRRDLDEVANRGHEIGNRVHFNLVNVEAPADSSYRNLDAQAGGGDGTAALGHVEAVPQVAGEAGVIGAGQIFHRADGGPTGGGVASIRGGAVRIGDLRDLQRVDAHAAIRTCAAAGVARGQSVVAAPGDAGDID